MSIPLLTQVYDEVRRVAIAGSLVAGGDFRLKKLVAPLEQAGQKAPVFTKVAQSVAKLVESSEKSSAETLLELSTLVNAILYTQGETGLEGSLEPISTSDLGQHQTQASARVLKPLLEALSSRGSGRLEIIKEAHEAGAFRDLRLVKPALDALDDPYQEIRDLVANLVLPLYGKAILSELRARFDPKGRGGHVRRLTLMHSLDPDGSRETVKMALDLGSKEVKVAAIECLGSSKDDLAFLLAQSKSKAREVREAALKALSKSTAGEAVEALRAALLGDDLELSIEPIRSSTNAQLLKFAIEEARAEFSALIASKKDRKAAGMHAGRMLSLLECLRGRTDKNTEELLLHCFEQRGQIAAIKGEPSGRDVEQRLLAIMASGPTKARKALVDAHASLSADDLPEAFTAAYGSRKAAEVFDLFSPYLLAKVYEKKQKRDPAFAKRAAIEKSLAEHCSAWRYFHASAADGDRANQLKKLDPRWLDLAVQERNLELVRLLARPGNAAANQFLTEVFAEHLKTTHDGAGCGPVLQAMIYAEHPAAADSLIALFSTHASGVYAHGFWIFQLIPSLPKAALPKLEAMLPLLPEPVLDRVLDYVTQLKNRP